MKVARYAEKIARQEKADLAVVLTAAYLHDIGIKEAERKYQSTSAQYQEKEGPPIARAILLKTYPNLHNDFLKDKTVMMGCPKFDDVQEYVKNFSLSLPRPIFKALLFS